MSEPDSLHGLSCPKCGGMVPIPEGQIIVRCPFCEQRSFVRGERGLRRYQVPLRVKPDAALAGLKQFLSGHRAIGGEVAKKARLTESFVAYLPFWVTWARVLGWVFGQKRVRRGKNTHYEPREIKIAQPMTWNGAACDVGEFGVTDLPLKSQQLDPFDPDELHTVGMVFEPLGSVSEAEATAQNDFEQRVQNLADLDRVAQTVVKLANRRLGLVYYPLWVLRYLYRGRAFQVVVDGYSGKVLYGKAPGSNAYRAAVLVGGMAAGAFLAIDVAALSAYIALSIEGDGAAAFLGGALAALVAGFTLMGKAYKKFRYGEIFEFRGHSTNRPRSERKKIGETYQAQEVVS